jgi:hypothetical protein
MQGVFVDHACIDHALNEFFEVRSRGLQALDSSRVCTSRLIQANKYGSCFVALRLRYRLHWMVDDDVGGVVSRKKRPSSQDFVTTRVGLPEVR